MGYVKIGGIKEFSTFVGNLKGLQNENTFEQAKTELLQSNKRTIKAMKYCRTCRTYNDYICVSKIWGENRKKYCPLCYLKYVGIRSYLQALDKLKEYDLYNQMTMIKLLKIAQQYVMENKL